MAGLCSSFQSKEDNAIVAEALKEYALESAEVAYKDPGE